MEREREREKGLNAVCLVCVRYVGASKEFHCFLVTLLHTLQIFLLSTWLKVELQKCVVDLKRKRGKETKSKRHTDRHECGAAYGSRRGCAGGGCNDMLKEGSQMCGTVHVNVDKLIGPIWSLGVSPLSFSLLLR